MSFIQIDQLARETFELGKRLGQLHHLDRMSDDFLDKIDSDEFWSQDTELESTSTIEDNPYPHAPGLLFKLEKGANTFCLRALAVDNIAEDAQDVIDDNRGLRKALRFDSNLSGNEVEEQLHYFETPILENAQILVETFGNQRFPIKESQLLNISDPGHDWWLEENSNQMIIHFRAPSIERSHYVNLGPLGDSRLAVARLQRLAPYLAKSIPSIRIKGSDRHLIFEVDGGHLMTPLKKLFREGENAWSTDESIETTLYLFLEELATARRFWKSICKFVQ